VCVCVSLLFVYNSAVHGKQQQSRCVCLCVRERETETERERERECVCVCDKIVEVVGILVQNPRACV